MDWIVGIQQAIDYIEDNLTETIDYEEVGKISCSSSYHFQRIFSIFCGYTLGEYIRNRRLTLAGKELATTNIKVIDVALKYGYESPIVLPRHFKSFTVYYLRRLVVMVAISNHFLVLYSNFLWKAAQP